MARTPQRTLIQPLVVTEGDHLQFEGTASVPTPPGGNGSLWVRSDAPSALIFTDDSGAEHELSAGGGGETAVRRQAVFTGLHGSQHVGFISNGVLRFDVGNLVVNDGIPDTPPIAEWAQVDDTENGGTSVLLLKSGIWNVNLMLTFPGSADAGRIGIAYNAPAATLEASTNPEPGVAGVRAAAVIGNPPFGPGLTIQISATILASDAEVAAEETRIHFLANGGFGDELGSVVASTVRAEITYIAALSGA